MIEIIGMGENTKITIPSSVLDPEKVKMGQVVTPKIKGKVCSISEHSVTLDVAEVDDEDEFDSMEDGAEKSKKMSKKMEDEMNSVEEIE